MKAEDINLWDWQRMFIGEVPPAFFLEIVFRMVFIYVLLMVSMRPFRKAHGLPVNTK